MFVQCSFVKKKNHLTAYSYSVRNELIEKIFNTKLFWRNLKNLHSFRYSTLKLQILLRFSFFLFFIIYDIKKFSHRSLIESISSQNTKTSHFADFLLQKKLDNFLGGTRDIIMRDQSFAFTRKQFSSEVFSFWKCVFKLFSNYLHEILDGSKVSNSN